MGLSRLPLPDDLDFKQSIIEAHQVKQGQFVPKSSIRGLRLVVVHQD